MKRSSAVRHLREMAEQATELLRLRGTSIPWPLEGMWAAGDLLGDRSDLDSAVVVLMLDLPPEDLPWLAVHPTAEWVSDQLGLGKRPVIWYHRPRLWPAWNPAHRRVTRIWAAPTGGVEAAFVALEEGRVAGHAIVEPSAREMREQAKLELEVSRPHLHGILDRYWDRRDPQRDFGFREDRLWRAAQGVRELEAMGGANDTVSLELERRRRHGARRE